MMHKLSFVNEEQILDAAAIDKTVMILPTMTMFYNNINCTAILFIRLIYNKIVFYKIN